MKKLSQNLSHCDTSAARLKEEKRRESKELEERKIKAEETRKIQIEEVKKTTEIERESLERIGERKSNNSKEQEKIDQS